MPPSPKGHDRHAALLDPYGIYGTRTAHRLRNMRRRQRVQQVILGLILIALVALGIYTWQTHRVPSLAATASWPLTVSPTAPPVWDASHHTLLIPTEDGQIMAVWPQSHPLRTQIWLKTDFPIHVSPVLGQKYFYVGTENGTLYAIERGTGKMAWWYRSGASITTQPHLLGNLLFCGNDDGWLAALRAKDGSLVWRRKLPSPIGDGLATVTTPSKMVIAPLIGNAVHNGGLWALDVNNGMVKWKFPAASRANAQQVTPPVAALIDWQTRLFCANDTGALMNLQAATGTYNGKGGGWKIYFPSQRQANARLLLRLPPLIDASASRPRLFICGNDDVVRCVDVHSSRLLWKWQAPAQVLQLLRTADGRILPVCRGSVSYLLNADTGEVGARIRGTSSSFQTMLTRDTSIWALHQDGTLQHFSLSNP